MANTPPALLVNGSDNFSRRIKVFLDSYLLGELSRYGSCVVLVS